MDGKLLIGDIRGKGILAKVFAQDSCNRQAKGLDIEGEGLGP